MTRIKTFEPTVSDSTEHFDDPPVYLPGTPTVSFVERIGRIGSKLRR